MRATAQCLLTHSGGGLILNLGSFAGQLSAPLLATYAGSKGFLISWTAALGEELRRSKVDVQLINAFYVVSNMSKMRKASLMVPSPKQFVHAALTRIGRPSGAIGRPFTGTPWPTHAWIDWAATNLAPRGLLLRYMYGLSFNIRRRALRKASRAQKVE